MKNSVLFEPDASVWFPVPRRAMLSDSYAQTWLDAAVRIVSRNAAAPEGEFPVIRKRCEAILAQAGEGERLVYAPLGEPFPTTVDIVAATDDAGWRRRVTELEQGGENTVNVAAEDVDPTYLENGRFVMRVDRNADGYEFRVAFHGVQAGVGVGLCASTDQPLVAGQIGAAGRALFESFRVAP